MSTSVQILLEEECTVLLERALLRQTLCAFGGDGLGKHGRSDTPRYFDVTDLRITVDADDPINIMGMVSICLRGYNADDVGHIKTDNNFEIALNTVLAKAGISKQALSWASIDEQVQGCVTFHIDIPELLGW